MPYTRIVPEVVRKRHCAILVLCLSLPTSRSQTSQDGVSQLNKTLNGKFLGQGTKPRDPVRPKHREPFNSQQYVIFWNSSMQLSGTQKNLTYWLLLKQLFPMDFVFFPIVREPSMVVMLRPSTSNPKLQTPKWLAKPVQDRKTFAYCPHPVTVYIRVLIKGCIVFSNCYRVGAVTKQNS